MGMMNKKVNLASWISVKERYPPFRWFVEALTSDKSMTNLGRMYVAYFQGDEGNFWTRESMTEMEWSDKGFKITHWRFLERDLYGRVPYLSVSKGEILNVILKKPCIDK